MTIDISKIQPGDKVTLAPLEVASVTDAGALAIRIGSWVYTPSRAQITAHRPAPREIGVGDRVHLVGRPTWKGMVRGVDGLDAWVKWDGHLPARTEWPLRDLTLVEGDQ